MANVYNSNPITLDTDMTSGWRANQTLNTKQWGIKVAKLAITANGTVATGTINVADPTDGTVLYTIQIPTPAATAPFTPIFVDFETTLAAWRDFKVTGLTATVTKMQIWYRA